MHRPLAEAAAAARRRRALPHARQARRPQARQVRRRRGRAEHEARVHHAPARGHVRSERDRPQPRLRELRPGLRHERQAGAAGQLPRVDVLQHRGPGESEAADDRGVPRRAGRRLIWGHLAFMSVEGYGRLDCAPAPRRRGARGATPPAAGATPPAAGAATPPAPAAAPDAAQAADAARLPPIRIGCTACASSTSPIR